MWAEHIGRPEPVANLTVILLVIDENGPNTARARENAQNRCLILCLIL